MPLGMTTEILVGAVHRTAQLRVCPVVSARMRRFTSTRESFQSQSPLPRNNRMEGFVDGAREIQPGYGVGVVIVETAIIAASNATTATAAARKSAIHTRSSCLPRGRNEDLFAKCSKCPSPDGVLSFDIFENDNAYAALVSSGVGIL
ncbi:MAG: hypothetical protein QOH24_1288 [Verrucomicrobiota bacterium]